LNFLDLFKNKKCLHVSHNDLDGVMSTILGLYYLEPICSKYKTLNTDKYDLSDERHLVTYIQYYDIFFFTDFPVDQELFRKLKGTGKTIIIADHHQSGNIYLKNLALENYYYNTEKCGAQIFLDEISRCIRIKKVIKDAVNLTQIYDLWKTSSEQWRDAKGLSNILWAQLDWNKSIQGTTKYRNFIDGMLFKFNSYTSFYFNDYEQKQILSAEKKELENFKQAKKNLQIRIDNLGNTYGYTECSSKMSIVSNLLLDELTELKYIAVRVTFNDSREGIIPKISLRTKEDRGINVASIAELYNSGGHRCAAGIDFRDFSIFENFREGKIHLI
jgi:oligoribonuclease NrnB/cAMP/cGMP phosphodiesterase (DHH superfamily)